LIYAGFFIRHASACPIPRFRSIPLREVRLCELSEGFPGRGVIGPGCFHRILEPTDLRPAVTAADLGHLATAVPLVVNALELPGPVPVRPAVAHVLRPGADTQVAPPVVEPVASTSTLLIKQMIELWD